MTRTVSASDYNAQRAEFVYLYDLEYSGGWVYLTNGAADIVANGNTYQAVGGALTHSAIEETEDARGQGVELYIDGVDQTIISTILSNNFRGRKARIYLMTVNPETGAVSGTPWMIFRGLQMSDYRISETRNPEGGTVTISTRLSSALGAVDLVRSVRSNPQSHNDMLARAGVVSPNDTLFYRVISLMNERIYWGVDGPADGSGISPNRGGTGPGNMGGEGSGGTGELP